MDQDAPAPATSKPERVPRNMDKPSTGARLRPTERPAFSTYEDADKRRPRSRPRSQDMRKRLEQRRDRW